MKKLILALTLTLLTPTAALASATPKPSAEGVKLGAVAAKKISAVKTPKKKKAQPSSRLAPYRWGTYKGSAEMAWDPYVRATGDTKRMLEPIALLPKAKWFGAWIPTNDIGSKTKDYIANVQAGDPNTLVQMTIFRMSPWYQESKTRPPNAREVRDYKRWITKSAAAIGDARVALVLQPDLTFLRTVPNFELSSSLIRYAAKKYGALPNTLVYLEAGAADWPAEGQGGAPEAVRLLEASGVKYVDGIATNTTHYSSTTLDIHRIAEIIELLKARGYTQELKGVINTSSNGQPFDFGQYQGPDPDDAWVCRRPADSRTCVALGIPPTADVSNPAWGLDPATAALADQYIDGYLWIGRPWLYRQNSPFLLKKAVKLVQTWAYYGHYVAQS